MFLFYIPNTPLCEGPSFGIGLDVLILVCPGGGAKLPLDGRHNLCELFFKRLSLLLLWLNESHIQHTAVLKDSGCLLCEWKISAS